MSIDELIAGLEDKDMASAIEEITANAGTSDADWEVLLAAAKIIVGLRHSVRE